jgi:hypothetical protein
VTIEQLGQGPLSSSVIWRGVVVGGGGATAGAHPPTAAARRSSRGRRDRRRRSPSPPAVEAAAGEGAPRAPRAAVSVDGTADGGSPRQAHLPNPQFASDAPSPRASPMRLRDDRRSRNGIESHQHRGQSRHERPLTGTTKWSSSSTHDRRRRRPDRDA